MGEFQITFGLFRRQRFATITPVTGGNDSWRRSRLVPA